MAQIKEIMIGTLTWHFHKCVLIRNEDSMKEFSDFLANE